MKKDIYKMFQIAFVFIGTIVGAGLASGKEITEFFTSYGLVSFIGIIFCGAFYIIMGTIISKISIRYELNSYSDVIKVIVLSKAGTINEFTSISPSVPRRRKKEAKAIIIRVPIILGIPKN